MPSTIIHTQAKRYERAVPEIQPGFTVRVHERIQEGDKERVQVFEGLVLHVHNGHTPADRSFTVRRVVSGVGVEKIFALHSPQIAKIEVKKVARVRRAKLFFLRGRAGKNARLSERFTEAGEFAAVVPPAQAEAAVEAPAEQPEVAEVTPVAEAPAEEKAPEAEQTQA